METATVRLVPGVQKGKSHAPGAGRPRVSPEGSRRLTITLSPAQYDYLDAQDGPIGATVRRIIDERRQYAPRQGQAGGSIRNRTDGPPAQRGRHK